jgi:hypothetical protein
MRPKVGGTHPPVAQLADLGVVGRRELYAAVVVADTGWRPETLRKEACQLLAGRHGGPMHTGWWMGTEYDVAEVW